MIKKNTIPKDLIKKNIWVNFKLLDRNGKTTKVPFQPNGDYAKSNEKATWNHIDKVLENLNNFDGIGFCFDDDICGIDIDKCINEQGEYSQIAKDIIEIMKGAYIEKSPSNTGLHIIFRANDIINKEKYYINNSNIGVEIYGVPSSKFFTFTGNYINTTENLPNLTNEVRFIQDKYMLKNTDKIKSALDKDTKLKELWYKQATGSGGTESEDDMALCSKLAYYLNNDYHLIKEYFLSSPYFYSKDEEHKNKCIVREDYLKTTIEKVLNQSNNNNNNNSNNNTTKILEPLKTISANDLQKKEIPQLKCIVENLIYEGLTILVSPPKFGKSWFSLHLCLCVANGEDFLTFNTNKSTCLYLALEDSYRRLQDRMNKLLEDKEAPSNFFFATDSYKTDTGLIHQLKFELEKNPSLSLIIIDTLQKVRRQQRSSNVYAEDYDEISQLKKFADLNHIAVIIVHHTKKDENASDPYNNISGSNGIAGSVDTMLVMSKAKRKDKETLFSITGRDISENNLIIIRNEETQKWELIGLEEELENKQTLIKYNNSPIVKVIKRLLKEDKIVKLTSQQIGEKIEEILGIEYSNAPRSISSEIRKFIDLFNQDNINVVLPPKNGGSTGRVFQFYNNND